MKIDEIAPLLRAAPLALETGWVLARFLPSLYLAENREHVAIELPW